MVNIDVPLYRTASNVAVPQYAHEGDAGLDLCSTVSCELAPFERATIPCGVAVAIPAGYCGLVIPRSGLASKHGVSIVNAPGLIDSGYRGEIKVVLINFDAQNTFTVEPGDRIAQLTIIQAPNVTLHEVDTLDSTARNDAGFGSSGVKAL